MRVVKRLIKIMAAVALFAIIGIAVLLGLLGLDHNRDTALPTPTGSFAVGRGTYVWSDAAQTDPFAPQPGTKRELFVWMWYPAAPPKPSQTVDDYLPAPWRKAVEHQRGVMKFLTRDLSRVRAHGIRDAELSPQQRLYPVVLMLGGFEFTSLAEDLASHGYVVVSFDAPYRSSLVVFPDGRIVERAPQNNPDLVSGAELEHLATKLVQAGSADLGFALDQLERMNASDPKLKYRLDMQRVGAFGRGAMALQFCHDDSRCKACIDVDGIPFGSVIREGVTQPVMFLLSDHTGESGEETRLAGSELRIRLLPAAKRSLAGNHDPRCESLHVQRRRGVEKSIAYARVARSRHCGDRWPPPSGRDGALHQHVLRRISEWVAGFGTQGPNGLSGGRIRPLILCVQRLTGELGRPHALRVSHFAYQELLLRPVQRSNAGLHANVLLINSRPDASSAGKYWAGFSGSRTPLPPVTHWKYFMSAHGWLSCSSKGACKS